MKKQLKVGHVELSMVGLSWSMGSCAVPVSEGQVLTLSLLICTKSPRFYGLSPSI